MKTLVDKYIRKNKDIVMIQFVNREYIRPKNNTIRFTKVVKNYLSKRKNYIKRVISCDFKVMCWFSIFISHL